MLPRPLLGPARNRLASGPGAPKASRSREGKEPSRGPSAAPGRGWLGPRVGTEAARSAPLSGCQRQIHSPRFGSPRQSAPAGGREFPGPETAPWRLSPRWEARDVPSQSPERCRHSPSPTAAGSLLPSAGPMPGGLRGPGGSGQEETVRPATRTGSPQPPRSGSSSLGSRALETRIPANSTSTEEAKPVPGSWKPPPQRPCLGRGAGPSQISPLDPPMLEPETPVQELRTRGNGTGDNSMGMVTGRWCGGDGEGWERYRTVLPRSTLRGSGPASSPPCVGHRVTAMTGGRGKAPGPSRSSRYSLSPLMLKGWKRDRGDRAAPEQETGTPLSPDWEHCRTGWGRPTQHGHASEPSTVAGDHKHRRAMSQPHKAHPALMQRTRVSRTPPGPSPGCAQHRSPHTWVLTCCSGAVTRLAQLSHSITMMERKRQAARIQRGRPERL